MHILTRYHLDVVLKMLTVRRLFNYTCKFLIMFVCCIFFVAFIIPNKCVHTDKIPVFSEIFCDKRIELLNTSGLLTDITGFKYRDVLFYDCDNKTHSLVEGNIERKCQYDGSWSGKEPVCEGLLSYCEIINFRAVSVFVLLLNTLTN